MPDDKQSKAAVLEEPGDGEDPVSFPPAFDADEETPEAVTELPQPIEAKKGNCPDGELEKLRPVCTLAEQNYQSVHEHIKAIRHANEVLSRVVDYIQNLRLDAEVVDIQVEVLPGA